MKNLMQDTIQGVHTMVPGVIAGFDPGACEASVTPCGKFKKPDGSMMDYPQLSGVPVLIAQGSAQTATIAYPIKPGDECILLFSEQALDTWRTKSESSTDLKFDLSNACAIVGLFSSPNPLMQEACDEDCMIIEKDGERIRLKEGEITIQAKSISLIANGDISITAGGNITLAGASVSISP